ncbi:restriction endonuclease [Sulfurimonas sp.]|uniref:McrC family protein n=1 Tax=Sulfurimonas sp. TaxID=2022749 RepID=UPI00262C59B1|nr:restriction endonuclease [Sulfurimonas sp.]
MTENIFYEYEKITNSQFIEYVQQNQHLHKYFKSRWGEIYPLQYCGILNFDSSDVYILPKISSREAERNLDIFIYMLFYSYDISIENEDMAAAKNKKSTILEILVQLFVKNLLKELKKGLYKTYITQQDNLTKLRGKYLLNENVKHNFTRNKIYCEYDEFSEDNELNRFFLFALQTLLPFVKNKKILKECELILCDVGTKKFDIQKLNIGFDRINHRFKQSYELALLLLQKMIPMFTQEKKSFAFLFDMNELFENFIGKIYKSLDRTTQTQRQKNYGSLVLKPDIVTFDMIIDTKYKKIGSRADLSAADKYQMFAYGTNFKIKNTMLLYPKHLETIFEDLKLGKDDTIVELKMRSIDLDFDGGYEEFIIEMKKRVEILG